MDAVLLDTCVLLKSYLCDTLLSIAEVGTFGRFGPTTFLRSYGATWSRRGPSQKPSSTAWGR
jgi:hypothetical protein